jgi:hypothetical protein
MINSTKIGYGAGAIVLLVTAFMFLNYLQNNSESNSSQTGRLDNESEITNPDLEELEIDRGPNTPRPELTEGQVQITGNYNMYAIGIAPDTLCLNPDNNSGLLCFSNQAEAKAMLNTSAAGQLGENNCDQITGRASIIYDNFEEGYLNTGGNSVRLVSVTRVISPPTCSPLT